MESTEEWYDRVIAPALMDLAKACEAKGVPFLAVVEYRPGDVGRTTAAVDKATTLMRMTHIASYTAPNMDGLVIQIAKDCRQRGVDMSNSFIMHLAHLN